MPKAARLGGVKEGCRQELQKAYREPQRENAQAADTGTPLHVGKETFTPTCLKYTFRQTAPSSYKLQCPSDFHQLKEMWTKDGGGLKNLKLKLLQEVAFKDQ